MNEEISNKQILEQLQATDIFADIPTSILERNLSQLKLLHFGKDEYIIRKDELGGSMYIIVRGKVKIHDNDFVVAHLLSGDYFGEMSLLNKAPRSMSVSTIEEVEVIKINQASFYNILKDQPDLIQKIIGHLVIRLRSQNNVLIDELKSREADLKRQVEAQTLLYRQQKERAEQSENFKQQFLANMSHEIRTPMNAVMGMTNLLIGKQPRQDQLNYLSGIKNSSEILLHIINDILDLSKIEAGKMELEKIDFSIRQVVEQVQQTLHHKATEKELELNTYIDEKIQDILIGDPVRLNQILMNLTGNAIKFTEKGSVSIKVILQSVSDKSNQIKFSVTDTGIGIPENKLEQVFEGFSQANTSDARKFGGTGLGLTISKQLVEMMGGSIGIESKEEGHVTNEPHGTTFFFTIEMKNGSSENIYNKIAAEERIDGNILNNTRILIVDDNEYNRIVAIDTISSKSKAETLAVDSGIEAIKVLKDKVFDVILMDLQMPEMDGYETTQYIRDHFPYPIKEIPIIALTASVLRNDIDRCLQAGMNSYITKPFKTSELIIGIANAMGIELQYETQKTENTIATHSQSNNITDLTYLKKFCEGDEARMKKYIGMFISAAPTLISKLEQALKLNDFEEIANQVHGGRTKMVMMGMEESRVLSISVEKTCRDSAIIDKPIQNILKIMEQIEKAQEELKLI